MQNKLLSALFTLHCYCYVTAVKVTLKIKLHVGVTMCF